MVLQDREGGEQGGHGVLLVVDLGDVVGSEPGAVDAGIVTVGLAVGQHPGDAGQAIVQVLPVDVEAGLALGEATDPAQALAHRAEPGGQRVGPAGLPLFEDGRPVDGHGDAAVPDRAVVQALEAGQARFPALRLIADL